LLGKYADKGAVVDFGRKAQYFTLDVLSDIAFGTPFGFVQTDSDVYRYIETTEKTLPMAMIATVVPFLITLFASPLVKPALPSEKDILGFGRVMRFVTKLPQTPKGTTLTRLLRSALPKLLRQNAMGQTGRYRGICLAHSSHTA
jgi:hypothetical protein